MSRLSKFVTKSNKTMNRLIYLRDKQCLKWSEIAAMPEFAKIGIPQQTLFMIYKGERDVPKKYRKALGEPETVTVSACSACGKAHNIDRACELEVTIKAKSKPRQREKKERYPEYYAWMFEATPASKFK